MEKETIENINEDIVKSVSKKIITATSAKKMPFKSLTFSVTKAGYGFVINDGNKSFSLRCGEKINVYMRNDKLDRKNTFIISDTTMDKLPNDSAIETYKKYCINTVYTLYKKWIELGQEEANDLGHYALYKY